MIKWYTGECFLFVLMQCACLAQLSFCENVNVSYYGPYDHIYPNVDITLKLQKCSIPINGSCPLYIALMMSYGGEADSRGVIPAIQMAIDHINDDPTMLPGYTLHYILKKTKVSPSFLLGTGNNSYKFASSFAV